MNRKKWISAAVTAAVARRYPVLWTAALFAVIPILLRSRSSLVEGALLIILGEIGVSSAPFIALAAFFAGAVGSLKYGSRGHVLAFVLWIVTFLAVAVLGIIMFEAFSPPREWSGSLALPGLVVMSCCFGALVGAVVLRISRYRRAVHAPCTDAVKDS